MAYFGLTGGVASGKSTAARMFESLGARIIDADQLGHDAIRSSEPAFREIVEVFGRDILTPSGEIDRRRLGAMVFSDPQKLQRLNGIVHPRIVAQTDYLVARYNSENPRKPIVVDAALLFEAGIGARFLKVIVAWCRPEQQVERLIARTSLSREEALERIARQMPAESKRARADFVIDCSGSLDQTRAQVEAIYPKLIQLLGDVED